MKVKVLQILFIGILVLTFSCRDSQKNIAEKTQTPIPVIFDTDCGPDYDDVGALAILHAFADSGYINILATMASNKHELVASSIDVINTYYGRPDIPIGAPKSDGVNIGASQKWPDSLIVKYPYNMMSTGEAPDAVKLYRKILSEQEDTTVTIISVGFLTNLGNLIISEPDELSPFSGKKLVEKKVKKWVCMGGKFPEGMEFNVFMDSLKSIIAIEQWPTEIIFTGFEIGEQIKTGLRLIEMPCKNNPVKDVFALSIPQSEKDENGRMSWDQTAVLIAVKGYENYFYINKGRFILFKNGYNEWKDSENGTHGYVMTKMPVPQITKLIEDLMMHETIVTK
jgi:inosine-uridine nucleoside N-ribohydrolase